MLEKGFDILLHLVQHSPKIDVLRKILKANLGGKVVKTRVRFHDDVQARFLFYEVLEHANTIDPCGKKSHYLAKKVMRRLNFKRRDLRVNIANGHP
jgi:hypothetical protein